jgi:predicted MFS family arabinose efflux permease
MIGEPGFAVFCALKIIWGLAYGPEEVAAQVVFVEFIPEELRGRMYALMNVVMSAAGLLGTAIAGPLSDRYGPTIAMFVAGLLFIAATLYAFAFSKGAHQIAQVRFEHPTQSDAATPQIDR